jgi:serine/threonine protein kinase
MVGIAVDGLDSARSTLSARSARRHSMSEYTPSFVAAVVAAALSKLDASSSTLPGGGNPFAHVPPPLLNLGTYVSSTSLSGSIPAEAAAALAPLFSSRRRSSSFIYPNLLLGSSVDLNVTLGELTLPLSGRDTDDQLTSARLEHWEMVLQEGRWCAIVPTERLLAMMLPIHSRRSSVDQLHSFGADSREPLLPPLLETIADEVVEPVYVRGTNTGAESTTSTSGSNHPALGTFSSTHTLRASVRVSPNWQATGSTGVLTLTTLREAVSGSTDGGGGGNENAVSSTSSHGNTPHAAADAKLRNNETPWAAHEDRSHSEDTVPSSLAPTVGFRPLAYATPMVIKRIRHQGIQGTGPAERDAAFAVRAVELQRRLADDRRISAEQLNVEYAFTRGIVLPAAARRTADATFVVMPFIPDGTLASFLNENPPPSMTQIQRLASDIAKGLEVLHRHLFAIHHDLTTSNILLHKVQEDPPIYGATVADFGCATLLTPTPGADTVSAHDSCSDSDDDGGSTGGSIPSMRSTQLARLSPQSVVVSRSTTDFVGSVAYMSPERIAGEPHGTSSDIWAFGILVLSMLIGRHPLRSEEQPFSPRLPRQNTAPNEVCKSAFDDVADGGDDEPFNNTVSTSHQVVGQLTEDADELEGASQQATFWRLVQLLEAGTQDLERRQAAVDEFVHSALDDCPNELTDTRLIEVIRACMQANPANRPSASGVLSMLATTTA